MNLNALLSFLERIERRPNKGLSQNFLIEPNVAAKIVRTAAISPGDAVLEIGPGPGALTSHLLDAGAKVYAVEKDTVFAKELSRLQTLDQRLVSYSADFLTFNLALLPPKLKVVANLPYHITTPILEKLIEALGQFTSFTLMVQDELADRIAACGGSSEFNSLALFVQYHLSLNDSFKVSPSCFYPRPRVDSKVLHLVPKPQAPGSGNQMFQLARRAFQQRRKTLRSTLRSFHDPQTITQALEEIGAQPDARPEALTLDQWIAFCSRLNEKRG